MCFRCSHIIYPISKKTWYDDIFLPSSEFQLKLFSGPESQWGLAEDFLSIGSNYFEFILVQKNTKLVYEQFHNIKSHFLTKDEYYLFYLVLLYLVFLRIVGTILQISPKLFEWYWLSSIDAAMIFIKDWNLKQLDLDISSSEFASQISFCLSSSINNVFYCYL